MGARARRRERRAVSGSVLRSTRGRAWGLVLAALGAGTADVRAFPACEELFVRGDANRDEKVEISDPIALLGHLFASAPLSACADAADANGDEKLDIADPIFLLGFLFRQGAAPPAPFPAPGTDEPCDGANNDGDADTDEGCDARLRKRRDAYTVREAFLVGDDDWRRVLCWVPVAVWSGGGTWCQRGYGTDARTCVYPLLVYHREGAAFDADSIVYFFQQYAPERVTLVGDAPPGLRELLTAPPERGAGLREAQIATAPSDSYLGYWRAYDRAVYAADDYETALLAASYAALLDVPLVIAGHEPAEFAADAQELICIGDVSHDGCAAHMTLQELRETYLAATGTTDVVLVNPDDLGIFTAERFVPEKSALPLDALYGKTSLAAAFLAGAKRALVLSSRARQWHAVDAALDADLAALALAPRHITIVAAPQAVGMAYTWSDPQIPGSEERAAADAWQYAETDGDALLDAAVGRIFGISLSDASACIARSLFHDRLVAHPNAVYVTGGHPLQIAAAEVYALGRVLAATGCTVTVTPGESNAPDWRQKALVVYRDHGLPHWAGIPAWEIPWLDNTLIVTLACLTCAFEESTDGDGRYDGPAGELFCARALRRGAVGYVGAVDTAGYINIDGIIARIFADGTTIGEAFRNAKNEAMVFETLLTGARGNTMRHYALLGDPTFRVLTARTMPAPRVELIQEGDAQRVYRLQAPAMRVPIPDEVRALCETPEQVVPLNFTTAVNKTLATANVLLWGFDIADGFVPTAVPPSWRLADMPAPDGRRFWAMRQIPASQSLFENAHDQGFSDVTQELTLFREAPDFVLEDFTIEGRELVFAAANRGNARLACSCTLSIVMLGLSCDRMPCPVTDFYVSPLYDPAFGITEELELAPSERRVHRVPIPETTLIGGRTRRFDDYPFFLVQAATTLPGDLIQRSYDNDTGQALLARP